MPGGWEWLIIIGVLVLLFGAKRLPEMARSVGQSARVFKGEMKGLRDDEWPGRPAAAASAPRSCRPSSGAVRHPAVNGHVRRAPVDGTGTTQPTEPAGATRPLTDAAPGEST